MAYARRSTRRGYSAGRGYNRSAPARRKSSTRRRTSSRSGGTMTLKIELGGASPVSRLNPTQVAGTLPRKAKF